MVLRVNSPGGSAVASEIILNATKRVRAKKPLVVSMGNVAASGGYYVAMGADTIFADATTITASIGVVGGKFATTDMWNKIGITWNSNRRGANAGLLSSDTVFTPTERKQNAGLDERRLRRVQGARGRGPRRQAQETDRRTGRRATCSPASRPSDLGLVDKIGTLEDAIRCVAERAKLKDYDVRVYPEPKNFMEVLVEELSDGDRDSNHLAIPVSALASPALASILDLALPYLKGLDRERLETVKAALRRLDLLQQERAVLMMPEISIRDPSR